MTALEARQKALDKQKNRWSKLPLEVKTSIQESVECGQLHCIVNTKLNNIELCNLRALGYNVRTAVKIMDEIYEICW